MNPLPLLSKITPNWNSEKTLANVWIARRPIDRSPDVSKTIQRLNTIRTWYKHERDQVDYFMNLAKYIDSALRIPIEKVVALNRAGKELVARILKEGIPLYCISK
jgi:hypothetical protein